MSILPKSKKGKHNSGKVNGSPKPNSKREKDKIDFQVEQLKELLVEDDSWQSVIAWVIVENNELNEDLLERLIDIPTNFTIIRPSDLNRNESEWNSDKNGKSSQKRKRSISPTSKKTAKSKDKVSKKNNEEKEKDLKGSVTECADELCTLLKKYILQLKIKDVENKGKKENDVASKELNDFYARYIILWGFYDSNLQQEFLNFNISVNAIINIKNKSSLTIENTPHTNKMQKKKQKVSPCYNAEEYSNFISKLEENMKNNMFLETNKDVLFLEYKVISAEKGVNKETYIISNFLNILKTIFEAKKQYKRYTKSLNLQEIPEIQGTLTLDETPLYSTMVSMVPLECITIPFIVYSMLEQVCWWDEHIFSKMDNAYENIQLLSADIGFSEVNSTEENHSVTPEESFVSENTTNTNTSSISEMTLENITPTLIDQRDEIKIKTFHLNLPEINFQKITTDLLLKSPVYKLWLNYPPVSLSRSKFYHYHTQKFKKCTENCYFNVNELFNIYLHHSIINILTLNPKRLSIRADEEELDYKGSDCYSVVSSKGITDDLNVQAYIQGLIGNILCKVLHKHPTNDSEFLESSSNTGKSSKQEINTSIQSISSESKKWYEIKTTTVTKNQSILDDKMNHRLNKKDKLKSFVFCPELIDLYENFNKYLKDEIDFTRNYEFIQNLPKNAMCQSLQRAYEDFANVDYFYSALTDTIFLWFNNSKDLTCSRQVKCILETPLGFRDFYKYKLGGQFSFEDKPNRGTVSSESAASFVKSDCFSNLSYSECPSSTSQMTNHSNESPKLTVSNLGSLRVEHNEHYEHFFSPDTTWVKVKKITHFSKLMTVSVSINKNNTLLYYDFIPESSTSSITVFIKLHNDTIARTILTWNPLLNNRDPDFGEIASFSSKNTRCSLVSDLSFTLPSGLFIEVVPIESIVGPFYIRQSYLLKGMKCGKIWEETHRCYLNNGTILIFYSDNTVNILYSNGTMVTCNNFEWEKVVLEKTLVDEYPLNQNGIEEIEIKGTKSTKNKKNEKKKPEDDNGNKKKNIIDSKKKNKVKKISSEDDFKNEQDESNGDVYFYKITQHSVVSWDGSYENFDHDNNTKSSKTHGLRMAFDKIHQELYLQRSDRLTSLFTPDQLSVLFPDGSKITSFIEDQKELSGDNLELQELNGSINEEESYDKVSVSYSDSIDDSDLSSSSQSHSSQDKYESKNNFVFVHSSFVIEHENYARVRYYNADCKVEIMLPGNIIVYLDRNGKFIIDSGRNEKISLTDDTLVFEAQVLKESCQKSISTMQFSKVTTNPTVSCKTVDSFCNVFTVSDKGYTSIVKNEESKNCDFCSTKHLPLLPGNLERYFVLNRDLSGYEMIHCFENKNNMEVIKTPIVKNNEELFSLYCQTPIFTDHSSKYLIPYVKEYNIPSLTKRKDLLEVKDMPDVIWFDPKHSIVFLEHTEENILNHTVMSNHKKRMIPSAISVFTCSKIKNKINIASWFSKAINKYIRTGENIIKQYLDHYPQETKNEQAYADGQLHKQQVLGPKSYYLTDNLPKVFMEDLLNDKSRVSIHTITESFCSKTPTVYIDQK